MLSIKAPFYFTLFVLIVFACKLDLVGFSKKKKKKRDSGPRTVSNKKKSRSLGFSLLAEIKVLHGGGDLVFGLQ